MRKRMRKDSGTELGRYELNLSDCAERSDPAPSFPLRRSDSDANASLKVRGAAPSLENGGKLGGGGDFKSGAPALIKLRRWTPWPRSRRGGDRRCWELEMLLKPGRSVTAPERAGRTTAGHNSPVWDPN